MILQRRKKKYRKKRTAFGEEANQLRTKREPFQALSFWERAHFLPGFARPSFRLRCVQSPAGPYSTAVAHQMFEALL